jgi:Xaa-Pro aminopeptidase
MFREDQRHHDEFLAYRRDSIQPLRQQWAMQDQLLEERLDTLMPDLMMQSGIACWIVVASEYNEDPIFDSLTPASVLNASRRMVLMFYLREDGTVERAIAGRYSLGTLYPRAGVTPTETVEEMIRTFILERSPRTIGINASDTFALTDGLSHTTYEWLMSVLGSDLALRTHSAESLAVRWLETRSATELAYYPTLIELSREIIHTAFSPNVIIPGQTTTEDVVWSMRQQVHDLGLKPAFAFTVSLDGQDSAFDPQAREKGRTLILPGDTLRCDFGVTHLGLTTDLQESLYVLKPGETDVPIGLQHAMATSNRAQDIVASAMKLGRTGNEILRAARERAHEQDIDACFYCHPIGTHVHGAGTPIGRWDCQEGLPGRGDIDLHDNTCHAIELYTKSTIPEWDNREFIMALEQDAAIIRGSFQWLAGRQTEFLML